MYNYNVDESEFEFANKLKALGFLRGPNKCSNNVFIIQKDSSNRTSCIIFRCNKYSCRKKYAIRCNSILKSKKKI